MTDKTTDWDFSNLSLEGEEEHPTSGKAQFGVEESPEETTYQGPDRRRGHRRQNADRREKLRFEEKKNRRSGKDRRKGHWENIYSL